MQVKCRSCQQPIPATNVNVQSMIAKCELCHAVFGLSPAELHGPGGARMTPPGAFSGGMMPPPGAFAGSGMSPGGVPLPTGLFGPISGGYAPVDRGQVPMPQGITVEIDGKSLVIRRVVHWAAIFLLVFSLIWSTFVLVFLAVGVGVIGFGMNAGGGDAWPIGLFGLLFTLLPLLFLFIGLAMFYFALAMFLNTTTIRVDAAEISVAHGPLPWWGNLTVLKSEVEQLFCVERVHHGKRGAVSFTYDVELILRGNVRQSLATQLSDVGQALFIEQQVERHLGLEDTPVAGEVRRW